VVEEEEREVELTERIIYLFFFGLTSGYLCLKRASKDVALSFLFFGATAPVWALAYLHETHRFTSVF
jgi:hypothetical protein